VGYDSPNKGEVYVAEGENSATFHLYAFAPVAEPETKEFLLTITKPGSGEGTVTSSPAGIVCGSECSAKFEEGKEVTLTASPAAGSTFTGWSGAGCSGTASCKVTMSEAKSVAAEFTEEESAPAFHTLTVTVSGEGEVSAGSGTITGCTSSAGPSCEGEYEEGASVVLTETPGAGSHFNGWQTLQCDESTASSCEVTIGSDDEGVAASFAPTAPEFPLAVEVEGSGTVTSEPGLISCNPLCSDEFEAGATVTLFATPAPGHTLLAWKGCGNVKGARCEVTMSSAKTVKASFTATPSLTVTKAGSGSGKVIAKGISCDANCSATAAVLKAGTAITLKATPSKGSEAAVFEGGTGNAGACTGGSCAFTLSEDSSVVVRFDPIPTKEITVNLTGPAAYKGKVKGKASVKGLTSSAINCGSGCTSTTEAFLSTSEIELSATAGLGYTFAGWSVEGEAGTCEGTTSPCALKTDAGKTLSAGFK
jgi:hypothetical protein